jgi:thiamine pyrophosphokinase
MPNAVILANGLPPSLATLSRALEDASLFVCADGGANIARRYGLQPDAIVGDLDSATPETLRHYAAVTIVRDQDTESTDTQKALSYALASARFDRVTLLGASAGRIDHVLGHLSLLRRHGGPETVVMEDDFTRAWIAGGSVALDVPAGTVVSFFAVGGAAEGVTTTNLRYALRGRRLELGAQDSISNIVEAEPAGVTIGRGELLFVVVKEP